MSFRGLSFVFVCLTLSGLAMISRAGMTSDTPFTEQGKADFDTILQILNPYGTWSKIGGKWAFTPRDHEAPYTNGRWIYTEYGWYWKGNLPHSWATEHYGYWKLSVDKVWSWYPGPFWLPEIVEIRETPTHIGWHSAEVDDDGNFVEAPIDRFSKSVEWTFITTNQFANPITPDMVAPPDVVKNELDDSTDSHHTYLTYREIDRPGPHPADVAKFCQDGKMLAPKTYRDELADESTLHSPALATNLSATKAAAAPPPELEGTDVPIDTRRVKYWITMSLPTYWTSPPSDAKPDEIYLYRPNLYQDQDGIERRITLWFNPKARATLTDLLGQQSVDVKKTVASAPNTPDTPAVPAAPEDNPFRSPLDENFQPGSAPHPNNTSSKTPASSPTNTAPSGAINPGLAH